jgi:hypothetical protein
MRWFSGYENACDVWLCSQFWKCITVLRFYHVLKMQKCSHYNPIICSQVLSCFDEMVLSAITCMILYSQLYQWSDNLFSCSIQFGCVLSLHFHLMGWSKWRIWERSYKTFWSLAMGLENIFCYIPIQIITMYWPKCFVYGTFFLFMTMTRISVHVISFGSGKLCQMYLFSCFFFKSSFFFQATCISSRKFSIAKFLLLVSSSRTWLKLLTWNMLLIQAPDVIWLEIAWAIGWKLSEQDSLPGNGCVLR